MKVNKQKARRLYKEGKTIYLNPCKRMFLPNHPFSMAIPINSQTDDSKGDTQTFDQWVNAFVVYNCNYETGYYPHYYLSEGKDTITA